MNYTSTIYVSAYPPVMLIFTGTSLSYSKVEILTLVWSSRTNYKPRYTVIGQPLSSFLNASTVSSRYNHPSRCSIQYLLLYHEQFTISFHCIRCNVNILEHTCTEPCSVTRNIKAIVNGLFFDY